MNKEKNVDPLKFRTETDGRQVALYTLSNGHAMEVDITNFGARIVSVRVPDRSGVARDVVLGFDNIDGYIHLPNDFGALIGRYANRIGDGKIVVDDKRVQLPQNNFNHTLHGGPRGWQYRVFEVVRSDKRTLEMRMVSPDGEQGFPGEVTITVIYSLTEENALEIAYHATTNKKTVINVTNHSYFNLSGDASLSITDHLLYINADRYTPSDDTFLPTGEICPVQETPMDFTQPRTIGAGIDRTNCEQIRNGHGYDHNWVLNTGEDIRTLAASLCSPESGIILEVYTTEPGMQVYTGNFLDGSIRGKYGIAYHRRAAVCLETQHYPDSPNRPEWPSTWLVPGKEFKSRTIFKFSVK